MGNNKIKLALLWSRDGGPMTSVNDLVMGLDPNRFEITFIYLSGYGAKTSLPLNAGFRVIYLSQRKKMRRFSLSLLWQLIKALKEHHIDLLHCHAHKATLYGTIAAQFARVRVVFAHVHGLNRSRGLRRKIANALLYPQIRTILAVAEKVREDILNNNWRVRPEQVVVLENSVDYERFAHISTTQQQSRQLAGIAPDAFVFGTVGRLVTTKGLSYLLEAFSLLIKQYPSAKLVLLGDGPLRIELEEQATKLKCAHNVVFLGFRSNVPELIRAFDVFVLSSVAEGMPRAILEVMAAGIPCIATRVGGIPEMLDDGKTGILVPSKDPQSLAEAMLKMATMDAGQRKTLADMGRAQVESIYSHDAVREKLRHLYEIAWAENVISKITLSAVKQEKIDAISSIH